LIITDKNGCTDTKSVSNYISITGPAADFSVADTGGCKGTSIQFNDLSTPTSNIRKWKWNFGDGQMQTFTSAPFIHQFKDSGYFKIELTVTDKQGCEDVMTKDSLIRITSPKAEFYAVNTLFCQEDLFNSKIPQQDLSQSIVGVLGMEVHLQIRIHCMYIPELTAHILLS